MWDSWLRLSDPSTALPGFWIKSLVATLHKCKPDRALCPLKGLWYYLIRTEHLTAGRKPLFLPLRQMASGKLSPNTISAWLKKMISLAYKVVGKDHFKDEAFRCLHLFRAHETRAFLTYWDALRSFLVGDFMAATLADGAPIIPLPLST